MREVVDALVRNRFDEQVGTVESYQKDYVAKLKEVESGSKPYVNVYSGISNYIIQKHVQGYIINKGKGGFDPVASKKLNELERGSYNGYLNYWDAESFVKFVAKLLYERYTKKKSK